MNGTDNRVKYTKMVIRNSLLQSLKETSLEKLTVKTICDKAEINRATFYRHYNDCYDVVDEIEQEMLAKIISIFSGKSMIDEFLIMLNNIKEHSETYILICSENGDRYFTQKIMKICYKQMKERMDKLFPHLSESKRQWLYEYTANGCAGILGVWIRSGMKEEPDDVAEFLSQLIQGKI